MSENDGSETDGCAEALLASANSALKKADFETARRDFKAALHASVAAGDRRQILRANFGLGVVALQDDDVAAARPYLEASLAEGCRVGDHSLIAASLTTLGGLAQRESRWMDARRLYEEALAIYRESQDTAGEGLALGHLGTVALLGEANVAAAREYYLAALAHSQALDDGAGAGYWLFRLGVVSAARNEPALAVQLAGAAESLYAAVGVPTPPVAAALYEPSGEAMRQALGESTFADLLARGRRMTLEEAVLLARATPGGELSPERP